MKLEYLGIFFERFGKLGLYRRMGLMMKLGFAKGCNVKRELGLMGWIIL